MHNAYDVELLTRPRWNAKMQNWYIWCRVGMNYYHYLFFEHPCMNRDKNATSPGWSQSWKNRCPWCMWHWKSGAVDVVWTIGCMMHSTNVKCVFDDNWIRGHEPWDFVVFWHSSRSRACCSSFGNTQKAFCFFQGQWIVRLPIPSWEIVSELDARDANGDFC